MTQGSVEEVEAYPGSTRVDRPIQTGATSIRLRVAPDLTLLNRWIAIGIGSIDCEVRQITAIENRDITIAALANDHLQNEVVKYIEGDRLSVEWWGAPLRQRSGEHGGDPGGWACGQRIGHAALSPTGDIQGQWAYPEFDKFLLHYVGRWQRLIHLAG